jgi:hypothetical protein
MNSHIYEVLPESETVLWDLWYPEAGTLLEWWNAADGSEWRWKIEFYNHT